MRNRYATPNDMIGLESGASLVWHLAEGDFLPCPVGGELLDMDYQPVTESIKGPALVQVQFMDAKKAGERGSCVVVRHKKDGCDCGACDKEIAAHGRLLLLPEKELLRWLIIFVKQGCDKYSKEKVSGTSDDPAVIAFQFQCAMAADMLPWASQEIPERRPPSLSTFLDRYSVQHLARASGDKGEVLNVTMTELQNECVGLRGLMDEAASTGEGSKATMNPHLFTSLVKKCAAHGGSMTPEEFGGFCEENR